MPKPTFTNLPEGKRRAIVDLALAEFGERPYNLASLSRIVERAGIAKGSIYQYFEHKQDLYLYLIEHAVERQLQLLRELPPPTGGGDFFALLRWQMSASVQVGLAAPELTRLMYRAHSDDLPFRAEVEARLRGAGAGHLAGLLAEARDRGEVDPAIDLELAALVIGSLLGDLRELVVRRLGTTVEAATTDLSRLAGPAAEAIYDQVIAILRHGLGPRGAASTTEGAQR